MARKKTAELAQEAESRDVFDEAIAARQAAAEAAPPPREIADTTAQPKQANSPDDSAAPLSQADKSEKKTNPVRSWSGRYTGAVQYNVLTDARLKKIIIKFHLAEGQRTPPDDVLAVMRSHKADAEGRSTGLRFEDLRLHGKVWTLPNDPEGRALTATIENDLQQVARKMEAEQARGR